MAETVSTRVKRLEESMARAFASIDALAEKQTKLDDVVVLLTEAQIRTEERFRETDERFGQLEDGGPNLGMATTDGDGEIPMRSANVQHVPRRARQRQMPGDPVRHHLDP